MAQPASTGLPFEQARLALNQAKQLVNTLDKTMPEVVKMGDQLRQAELTLVAANKLYTQTMETAVKFKTPSRTKECVNPVTGLKRVLAVMDSAPSMPRRKIEATERIPMTRKKLQEFVQQHGSEFPGLELSIMDEENKVGLKVDCKHVFRTGLWFAEEHGIDMLQPDGALVFGYDESFNRWRTTSYRIFCILTERASMAAAYFWTREADAVDALRAFLEWMALHKTIFSDVSVEDGRRLAFDATSGIFLPPCVRPFEEDQTPRHPRGCIPKDPHRTTRDQEKEKKAQPVEQAQQAQQAQKASQMQRPQQAPKMQRTQPALQAQRTQQAQHTQRALTPPSQAQQAQKAQQSQMLQTQPAQAQSTVPLTAQQGDLAHRQRQQQHLRQQQLLLQQQKRPQQVEQNGAAQQQRTAVGSANNAHIQVVATPQKQPAMPGQI